MCRSLLFVVSTRASWIAGIAIVMGMVGSVSSASEIVRLSDANRGEFVPQGKEVDAIAGDFVLRNDSIVAVVAQPLPGRNANMTVRNVGGMLIDLTCRDRESDQLSCYYANAQQFAFHSGDSVRYEVDGKSVTAEGDEVFDGEVVSLVLTSSANRQGVRCELRYELGSDATGLKVTSRYLGNGDTAVELTARDSVRADRTFQSGTTESLNAFWFYDRWFEQAYGVTSTRKAVSQGNGRGLAVEWHDEDSGPLLEVPAGGAVEVVRTITPEAGTLGLFTELSSGLVAETSVVSVEVTDPAGAVSGADVSCYQGDELWGHGRTDDEGRLVFAVSPGEYRVEVASIGRGSKSQEIEIDGDAEVSCELPAAGYVSVTVTDGDGESIPFKVGFYGVDGTPDPDYGPDSLSVATGNIGYSASGGFTSAIGPGSYDVVISRGPEYDASVQRITVARGKTTEVAAALPRVVDTAGWVSTEYHSHSTPSGDNTSDQRGRVLNLLAEHLEFAPCTEHNRIDSYVPHLEALKAMDLMATCTGMELTGSQLPVNHQNAFPLVMRPFRQDGGAPLTDANPIVQIARLAMWDDGAPKLVQTNHPNLRQIYGDGNVDGTPDGGFREMFGYMDVMEVHPPADIFKVPSNLQPTDRGNVMFHWMQLMNLGYRIPGVVNTDAHYNFHGSGSLRNWVRSSSDLPTGIDVTEMVEHSEQGKIIMSTGPYLEVTARSGTQSAEVGGDLRAEEGKVELDVRVQCPNWLDVNRVQVFVNGRPVEDHDYRRRTHADLFSNDVVKFEATIELSLEEDAHVIVATIGEGLELGRVMGPSYGKMAPCAVANPFFVDVDGGGFKANGDSLGQPLPTVGE